MVSYLPVGSEEATKWYVEQALRGGRRLRQRHPGVHRPRAVLAAPLRRGGPADHRRRHQEPGRRHHQPSRADAPVHGPRRAPRPHLPAELRRQHGLPEHARARAPGVQEDQQDQRRHVDARLRASTRTTSTSARRTTCRGCKDRKWCYIRMEGTTYGDVPLNVELKLEVWDSPNSAGVITDAIRCLKLGLDRGLKGTLVAPSSLLHEEPAHPDPRRHRLQPRRGVHPRRGQRDARRHRDAQAAEDAASWLPSRTAPSRLQPAAPPTARPRSRKGGLGRASRRSPQACRNRRRRATAEAATPVPATVAVAGRADGAQLRRRYAPHRRIESAGLRRLVRRVARAGRDRRLPAASAGARRIPTAISEPVARALFRGGYYGWRAEAPHRPGQRSPRAGPARRRSRGRPAGAADLRQLRELRPRAHAPAQPAGRRAAAPGARAAPITAPESFLALWERCRAEGAASSSCPGTSAASSCSPPPSRCAACRPTGWPTTRPTRSCSRASTRQRARWGVQDHPVAQPARGLPGAAPAGRGRAGRGLGLPAGRRAGPAVRCRGRRCPPGPATLAAKTGALILPVVNRRQPDGTLRGQPRRADRGRRRDTPAEPPARHPADRRRARGDGARGAGAVVLLQAHVAGERRGSGARSRSARQQMAGAVTPRRARPRCAASARRTRRRRSRPRPAGPVGGSARLRAAPAGRPGRPRGRLPRAAGAALADAAAAALWYRLPTCARRRAAGWTRARPRRARAAASGSRGRSARSSALVRAAFGHWVRTYAESAVAPRVRRQARCADPRGEPRGATAAPPVRPCRAVAASTSASTSAPSSWPRCMPRAGSQVSIAGPMETVGESGPARLFREDAPRGSGSASCRCDDAARELDGAPGAWRGAWHSSPTASSAARAPGWSSSGRRPALPARACRAGRRIGRRGLRGRRCARRLGALGRRASIRSSFRRGGRAASGVKDALEQETRALEQPGRRRARAVVVAVLSPSGRPHA